MAEKDIIKLLIIEDDEIQRKLLKEMLKKLAHLSRHGFQVKMISSGKRGLKVAMEWEPELVFLDIHLPDIDGLNILHQMKANNLLDETLVLIMTGDTSEKTAISGLSEGASDIIFKPVRTIELALKIANLLEMKSSRKKLSELNAKLEEEKKILSKFFSEDLMQHILKEKGFSELGGIDTYAAVMFFDIRNSTGLAEELGPARFADLLSDIFNGVTSIIYGTYGSVNKFLGDGVLSTFGAPVVYGNDPYNAVRAAVGIRQFIEEFNRRRPDYLKEELKYGIGIASGKVFAGNIGSKHRMEYTVLGDPVNIASRLQSLTKPAGTDILIEQNTYGETAPVLEVEKMDFSNIRGRIGAIDIYAVRSIDEAKADELYVQSKQVTYDNLDEIGEVEFF